MFSILPIILILFFIVKFFQGREEKKSFKYAREIVSRFDLKAMFDDDFYGRFSFEDKLPAKQDYARLSERIDAGADKRLAMLLVKSLPKWMLEYAARDMRQGNRNPKASHIVKVLTVLTRFIKARNARILELLNGQHDPISTPNASQRSRRRRR